MDFKINNGSCSRVWFERCRDAYTLKIAELGSRKDGQSKRWKKQLDSRDFSEINQRACKSQSCNHIFRWRDNTNISCEHYSGLALQDSQFIEERGGKFAAFKTTIGSASCKQYFPWHWQRSGEGARQSERPHSLILRCCLPCSKHSLIVQGCVSFR